MNELAILRAQIEVLQVIKTHVQGLINDRVEAIRAVEKASHEAEFGYAGHEAEKAVDKRKELP